MRPGILNWATHKCVFSLTLSLSLCLSVPMKSCKSGFRLCACFSVPSLSGDTWSCVPSRAWPSWQQHSSFSFEKRRPAFGASCSLCLPSTCVRFSVFWKLPGVLPPPTLIAAATSSSQLFTCGMAGLQVRIYQFSHLLRDVDPDLFHHFVLCPLPGSLHPHLLFSVTTRRGTFSP